MADFRQAMQSDALPGRDQALFALLDAGLSPTEISRLWREDVFRMRGDRLAVRVVSCRTCEASQRGRARFVPLDELQSAYLRRHLAATAAAAHVRQLFCGRGSDPLGVRGIWHLVYRLEPKEAAG